jgi:hypothetical protein
MILSSTYGRKSHIWQYVSSSDNDELRLRHPIIFSWNDTPHVQTNDFNFILILSKDPFENYIEYFPYLLEKNICTWDLALLFIMAIDKYYPKSPNNKIKVIASKAYPIFTLTKPNKFRSCKLRAWNLIFRFTWQH